MCAATEPGGHNSMVRSANARSIGMADQQGVPEVVVVSPQDLDGLLRVQRPEQFRRTRYRLRLDHPSGEVDIDSPEQFGTDLCIEHLSETVPVG